jgi:hypothetical protein
MIEDPEDPLHFEDPREKVSEKKRGDDTPEAMNRPGLIPNQYRLVSNSAAV